MKCSESLYFDWEGCIFFLSQGKLWNCVAVFSVKQFFIILMLWKVLWTLIEPVDFKARQVLLHVEKKRKVDWKCNSAIKTINRVLSVIDPEKKLENLLDFVLIKEKMFKLCWKEVLARNHQVLLYEPVAFLQLPFVWEARRNSSQ